MKTNEEKAKAYDEAVNKIKPLYEQAKRDGNPIWSTYEYLIPELCESEDERIRRKMIEHFKSKTKETWCNMPVKDIIAYLEKSADSISEDCASNAKCGNSRHKVGDSLESKRLANEVIEYLTKCGYSPVLKDDSKKEHFHIDIPRHEDDFWLSKEYKHCRSVLGEYYMEGDYGGDTYTLYIWRGKKEQKPTEKHNMAAKLKEHLANTPKEQLEAEWKELEKWNHVGPTVEEYFRSIKPVEWSEEDELMRTVIIQTLERFGGRGTTEMQIDWLKSLRPCPSWKPSDEQMEAMEFVIKDYREDGCTATANYLQEILDQIKKL